MIIIEINILSKQCQNESKNLLRTIFLQFTIEEKVNSVIQFIGNDNEKCFLPDLS